MPYTVQLNLNFIHMCQYTHVSACLLHVKLKKLASTCTVACNYGIRTIASEHTQHMSDARHELVLGLQNYMYSVQVDNEMLRFCS